MRKRRNKLVSKHVKGKKIIDVGCGTGNLINYLDSNVEYIGTDKNIRKNVNPKVKVIQMDIESALVDLGKADCVTMNAVIEHLKEPTKAIHNIGKLLNSGGNFIITTPTPIGGVVHKLLSKIEITSKKAADEHERFFSYEDLVRILEKEGFKIIDRKKFFLGLNQMIIAEK